MKVKFNHPRLLGSKMYGKGTHEVPDQFLEDWFFKAIEKVGDVEVIPAAVEKSAAVGEPIVPVVAPVVVEPKAKKTRKKG